MCRVALLCMASLASAFYLPGVAPRDYQEGEVVEITVNRLESSVSPLTFEYYSLDFCKPAEITHVAENLGEVMNGDVIENSPFEVYMQQEENCKILCRKHYGPVRLKRFEGLIRRKYKLNWIADNMPAATRMSLVDDKNNEVGDVYDKGFPLGFVEGGRGKSKARAKEIAYLNNHHAITITTHQDPESYTGYRVVGFEVVPTSVKHKVMGKWTGKSTKLSTCEGGIAGQPVSGPGVEGDDKIEVIFTYAIKWASSDVKWASRWDLYLQMINPEIHWFHITNSLILVAIIAVLVGTVFLRTIHRDLVFYNQVLDDDESAEDESGWKLLARDVFRPPAFPSLLATLVGSGVQLLSMTVAMLVFAMLGLFSPANRGGLMSGALILFVLLGMVAGYHATRFTMHFQQPSSPIMTATLVPGFVFAVFFILNLILWSQQASGALPFTTLIALLFLWFGISLPLVYAGGMCAARSPAAQPPVRAGKVPRPIPEESNTLGHHIATAAAGGLVPFSAIYLELNFILTSVWSRQFYYMFGFLTIVVVLAIVTVALCALMLCYMQLNKEDHNWWWSAFFNGAACGFYLFLYSIYYFSFMEMATGVSALIYFGYMILASMLFGLMTGTVAVLSCFAFVHRLYNSIRLD